MKNPHCWLQDEDVAAERKKVETLVPTQGEYAVILKNLSKVMSIYILCSYMRSAAVQIECVKNVM